MMKIKTLYDQPIVSDDQIPPTTIKVVTQMKSEFVGGVPGSSTKTNTYILFEILPDSLKRQVFDAVQMASQNI